MSMKTSLLETADSEYAEKRMSFFDGTSFPFSFFFFFSFFSLEQGRFGGAIDGREASLQARGPCW